MGEESRVASVALSAVEGIGDRTYRELTDRFGSAEAALAAGEAEFLRRMPGAQKLFRRLRNADRKAARQAVAKTRDAGFWIVGYGEPGYPARLAAIYDPPALLYGSGILEGDARDAVAVVGSRRATPSGLKTAERLGADLAAQGIAVVSGLADGIDAAAHRGALTGGGRTVAVLGSGPDVIYPARNRKLSERILESGGALVSEHPPGRKPDPRFFPRRNRIISGLSAGVVVVEAAAKSGSLITASLALEQGREVFAVPGLAGSDAARGTNNLLRQGARLVEGAADVLEELGWEERPPSAPASCAKAAARDDADLGETARTVRDRLDDAPEEIDRIAARCGLDSATASAALMELVLSGHALEWPGKRFSKATN